MKNQINMYLKKILVKDYPLKITGIKEFMILF